MKNSVRILLLDGQTVQAFSVAKALKKCNMHVTIFCDNIISYGYASRYPDKKVKCPSIKKSSAIYNSFLLNFLKINPIDLIMPLFDDSADLINKNRIEIEKLGVKIGLPPKNQYELARNKSLLMEFCRNNNIPHPITVPVDKNNYKSAASSVGFPLLIKPDKYSGAIGIIHINTITELSEYFLNPNNNHQGLSLQSYVNHSGYYYNAMLYRSREGLFSEVVIIKVIRYFPIKGGTGSYNETVNFPKIEKISKDTLNKLNWVGFADIDFIVDEDTAEPRLIEINPRIPACIHSAYISGVNFPQIIVFDTLYNKIPNQIYIPKKKTRYMAMDVLWFIFSKERMKTKPSWFKLFGRNLYYQDGSWSDPLTMVAGILMGLVKYLNPSYSSKKLKNI